MLCAWRYDKLAGIDASVPHPDTNTSLVRPTEGKLLVQGHTAGGGRARLGTQAAWLQSLPVILCPTGCEGNGTKTGTRSPHIPGSVPPSPFLVKNAQLATLLHPTHQRTSLPGLCSLSPWPSARVSAGGCHWGAPGECLPSTGPPSRTWGEGMSPDLQPASRIFTGAPLPWALRCGELPVCPVELPSPLPGQAWRPDSASWVSGGPRAGGLQVGWKGRRRCHLGFQKEYVPKWS